MATRMVKPQTNKQRTVGVKTHFNETDSVSKSYRDTPINTPRSNYNEGMYTNTFGNTNYYNMMNDDYLGSSKYDDVQVYDNEELLTQILDVLNDIKMQLGKLTGTPTSQPLQQPMQKPLQQPMQPVVNNVTENYNQFAPTPYTNNPYQAQRSTPSQFIPYAQTSPQFTMNSMLDQPVEFVDNPRGMYYEDPSFSTIVPGGYSNESMGDATKPPKVQAEAITNGYMTNNNYDTMDLEGSWSHYDDDIIVPEN